MPEERRVVLVVGLVGTGRHGEARGRSGGARLRRRGGERWWRLSARRRTRWRRGWGRWRTVGGDAEAHDLRGGRRRAVSGSRLDGGHGGTAAYPGNGEGDGGVAHSDKRGQKQSGSFGHGLSGWHVRPSERPGCRDGVAAVRTRTWHVRTAPLRHGMRGGTRAWQPRGDGALTGGSHASAISKIKFTPGCK
jgi:hypothetical protein